MSKPSAITSVLPYVNTRFAKFERFSTSIGRATAVPKTNMYCLLENGVNVRKSSIVSIIEPHSILSEG